MRLPAFIAAIVLITIAACSKKNNNFNPPESELYGKWAKGPNLSDTIAFSFKNGQHIMRFYDPGLPQTYIDKHLECEYTFTSGTLSIKRYPVVSNEFFPINSFTWTQRGSEFTIMGGQLYPYLSSTPTFKYKKVQ